MKLFTKKISTCMACPHREVKDEVIDKAVWIVAHTCTVKNKIIERISMHLIDKKTLKKVKIYKEWFPDWCPLEECE